MRVNRTAFELGLAMACIKLLIFVCAYSAVISTYQEMHRQIAFEKLAHGWLVFVSYLSSAFLAHLLAIFAALALRSRNGMSLRVAAACSITNGAMAFFLTQDWDSVRQAALFGLLSAVIVLCLPWGRTRLAAASNSAELESA